MEDAAEPAGGEAGAPGRGAAGGFVDGDDAVDFEGGVLEGLGGGVGVVGVGEELELGLEHFEAAGGGAGGLDGAVEGDEGAEGEAVFEVGAVEPHGFEGGGALADGELKEGHAGGAKEGGAADFRDDGGGGAGLEGRDGLGVEAVFVAEGQVVEEVFDGEDALAGELGGDAVADAFDKAKGRGEIGHCIGW